MKKVLAKIPAILSSGPSIFIFMFLFFYLVLYALICLLIPTLSPYAPSSDVQLIMGNYTNVVSALGASLAAGTGVITNSSIRELHKNHEKLHLAIKELHTKIDRMEKHNIEDSPAT